MACLKSAALALMRARRGFAVASMWCVCVCRWVYLMRNETHGSIQASITEIHIILVHTDKPAETYYLHWGESARLYWIVIKHYSWIKWNREHGSARETKTYA